MNKKTLKEKWQDKKYQAKVKLSGYGIFILIILIMIIFGGNNNISSTIDDSKLDITIPSKDNYTINISYELDNKNNEINYVINNNLITKQVKDLEYNYKYLDGKYYIKKEDNYILTDISKVYDYISYDYLDSININNYLSLAKIVDDKYIIDLRDIILNNDSNLSIEITINDNIVIIDYTNLLSIVDNKDYTSYIVTLEYL